MSQTKTLNSKQSYRDKIFYKFMCMETSEVFNLTTNVSPETMGEFISESKQLIDEDLLPDHYLEFSDDYSLLKKKAKVFSNNYPSRN